MKLSKQAKRKLKKILDGFAYHKDKCAGWCECPKGNYAYAYEQIAEAMREELIKNIKVKV